MRVATVYRSVPISHLTHTTFASTLIRLRFAQPPSLKRRLAELGFPWGKLSAQLTDEGSYGLP
ncbi:MAG: hypothetical protein IJ499_01775 [Clostridia bacterium]|nr:hypothetical protein [Clostridia bacterium]